jgi:hypothetical protein
VDVDAVPALWVLPQAAMVTLSAVTAVMARSPRRETLFIVEHLSSQLDPVCA